MSNNILNDISKVYLETVAESAVPGKPAEKLGAVSAIPTDEREAARQRTLAKAAAIRAKKGITQEGLDPVGKEDADVDNDGKSNTKKDKYLMNRRNVIKQELATQKEAKEVKKWWDDDGDGKGYEEGEVSGKFKKKKVKEGKEYDPMEDPDFDPHEAEKNRGVSGKNNPKGGKSLGKKKIKEGFSNWREDLFEVSENGDKESDQSKIKEKKVNNKIKTSAMGGGIKVSEAIENLGGELIEMVELEESDIFEGVLDEFHDSELMFLSNQLIEEVVEEFFYECVEEGYEIDYIAESLMESLETSLTMLNEAKVTLGHDTKIDRKSARLEKVKSAVKKVARGVGHAAGAVVRGAKAIGREVKAGYAAGRGSDGESSSSSGTRKPQPYRNTHQQSKKPGLLSRLGSKLKSGLKKAVASGARAVSRGARDVARKMDGGGSSPTPKSTPAPAAKKPAEKSADPWEGSATTPPKAKPAAKAKPATKPKAKKKTGKLDSLLSSIRNEEVELDEAEGSYGQTPKAQQKMGDLANKRRNTPASEYSERGEKKKKVDSASRHFNRMGNPDAGNKGKKSSRPYYPAGRKGMTQKDRDWSRGADEYGHSGYDGEGGGGSLPKGKKLERQRKTGVSAESFNIDERALDATETKEKERIVKGMKKNLAGFRARYGDRAKEVMYATATKNAKDGMNTSKSDRRYGVEEETIPGEGVLDKQKYSNMKMVQQKQDQLRKQKLNLQKSGKLPLDDN